MSGIPTCPRCGHHDRSLVVDHPDGRFFCACGSLFNGDEAEWHRLTLYRREAIERRTGQTDHVIQEAS